MYTNVQQLGLFSMRPPIKSLNVNVDLSVQLKMYVSFKQLAQIKIDSDGRLISFDVGSGTVGMLEASQC